MYEIDGDFINQNMKYRERKFSWYGGILNLVLIQLSVRDEENVWQLEVGKENFRQRQSFERYCEKNGENIV